MGNHNDDAAEITELVGLYAAKAADRDSASQAVCFTEDGEAHGYTAAFGEGDAPLIGPEAIRSFLARTHEAVEYIHLLWQTVQIEVDGDHATARTLVTEWTTLSSGPLVQMMGHFDDVFRREDGRWLFERRTLVPKKLVGLDEVPFR